MVENTSAQLYTIEGLTAAILMVTTAYLVLSSTTTITPADTHISDLQLEQLGNDVLLMMDIPNSPYEPSELEQIMSKINDADYSSWNINFKTTFSSYLNTRLSILTPTQDTIKYQVSFFDSSGQKIPEATLLSIAPSKRTEKEHTVRVTRFVRMVSTPPATTEEFWIVEAILWRD